MSIVPLLGCSDLGDGSTEFELCRARKAHWGSQLTRGRWKKLDVERLAQVLSERMLTFQVNYQLADGKAEEKTGTREHNGQYSCQTPSPTSVKERHMASMRAIVYDTFGGPDVLHLREVALPEPGPGQVRVVIYAAGTNPVDAQNRQDGSWADLHPPVIPGCDASGVIDVVGPGVTRFAPGDEVFYMVDFLRNSRGTYAEYQVVDAALIARKPQNLTHVEAAALPLAAGTAYEMIIRRLALTQGEWVLLYGAAGGVGSLALQMAVAQGVYVIAVARAQHHALLSALGAVACLDYTTQDVEALAPKIAGRKLDAVADFVGGETLAQSLVVIRPYGRAASSVGVKGDLDRLLDLNLTLHGILVRPEQKRLEALDLLVSTGALRPIIDQVLPLQEAAQAHRRLESGHGQGKIVLVVREQRNDQLQR